jgi:hypothetical protein
VRVRRLGLDIPLSRHYKNKRLRANSNVELTTETGEIRDVERSFVPCYSWWYNIGASRVRAQMRTARAPPPLICFCATSGRVP